MPPKHEKLLNKIRHSLAGCGANELDSLYQGFGFRKREGRAHTVYYHPVHKELRATVGRHRKLSKAYFRDAIGIIERLKVLEGNEE